MKNRVFAIILIISFFSVLLIPFAVEKFAKNTTFEKSKENRNLARMPEKFKWRKFFPALEEYYNDRIPFRTELLHWCGKVQRALFPIPQGNAVAGKKDFFFYQPPTWENTIEQFRGKKKLRHYELESRRNYLLELRSFLSNHNIKFMMVIAPNKIQIYPEYLPERRNYPESTDTPDRQLVRYIKMHHPDFPILSLHKTLLNAKKHYPDALFYRADTHWSPVGAYIGAREIILHFSPELPLPPAGRFAIVKNGKKEPQDTSNQMFNGDAAVEYPEFIPDIPGGCHGKVKIISPAYIISCNPSAPDKRKVMVYRDSFFENMRPWLSACFREVHYIWSRNIDTALVLKVQPDIFILEYVARQVGRMPKRL